MDFVSSLVPGLSLPVDLSIYVDFVLCTPFSLAEFGSFCHCWSFAVGALYLDFGLFGWSFGGWLWLVAVGAAAFALLGR